MDIASEKLTILNEVAQGKNVFITGSAGTGKTFLLKMIKDRYANYGLHLTASTGIAAVHIGGVTLHSWAALGIGNAPLSEIISYINSGKGTRIRRKLKKTKMLAIDEVSMISAQIFDLLDQVLKEVRGSTKPFGGVQLVLFGDFLQLPPVGSNNLEQKFCFESEAWSQAKIKIYCLREVFRQSDRKFVELLNNIRFGQVTEENLNLLASRKIEVEDGLIKPTIIATHNRQIEIINNTELAKLPGKEYIFNMNASGTDDKVAFLKKNCLASEQLVLKEGAQVMMLKNTLQKDGIINGSLGVIQSFTGTGLPIVTFSNGKTITIEKEEWLIEEYNHEKLCMEVKARVSQIPLMLAWAITVHKSQGMTLDKVECDLAGAFEEGQIYVALSRVKLLEGLYLKSFNPKFIKINPKIKEFYNQLDEIYNNAA